MDINNNQQINTFTKGMDTDTSDMYIGEGSYRYAENLRVVTDKDGNTGELHMIDGTYKLPNHTKLNAGFIGKEELLGFTSIRDIIIEIIKEGDSWSIVKSGESGERILVAGPFYELIWPDNWDEKKNQKPLSLVMRWESEDNIKLYIANGQTELLCANIARSNLGSDYDKVFHAIKTTLDPINAEITDIKGAAIPGVVLQYAYIVYNVQGEATTMSMLSNTVVQQIDDVHGNKVDELGTSVVKLTLPDKLLDTYVRIYRVAYSAAGQLPRVDVIFDQNCLSTTVQDSGQSLLNLSTAEFIATTKLLFIPKEIESKGDYLFAANIRYTQDEIDKKFKDFDARCYSYGNYYIQNDKKVEGLFMFTDDQLENVPLNIDLHHTQFDSTAYEWDGQAWVSTGSDSGDVNGHGLCFDWKYVYGSGTLPYTDEFHNAYGEDLLRVSQRTYGRNEVYRFGVRLFDDKGNASSVKWIADIKMPGYEDGDPYVSFYSDNRKLESIQSHPVYIKFIPRNTDKKYWQGVSKYEIVLAKRSVHDSYKITLGICGFPVRDDTGELCLPYFMTLAPFKIRRGFAMYVPAEGADNASTDAQAHCGFMFAAVDESDSDTDDKDAALLDFDLDTSNLLFASPEYVYQPDDIQNLIQLYKSGIKYKTVCSWTRNASIEAVTPSINNDLRFNAQEFIANSKYTTGRYSNTKYKILEGTGNIYAPINMLKYDVSKTQNPLCNTGTDLRIQVGTTDEHKGEYLLSNQVMYEYNGHNGTMSTYWLPVESENTDIRCRKIAYFTNMYPENTLLRSNYDLDGQIKDVSFIKSLAAEDLARDERATYKSNFTTLPGGDKFFNWTNPAMFYKDIYAEFRNVGDTENGSWKYTTMSAYSPGRHWTGTKYRWSYDITDINEEFNTYEFRRRTTGGRSLSFPMSTGGPVMVLGLNSPLLTIKLYNFSTSGGVAPMPPITTINICKQATPYGGYNINSINSTQYISCGIVCEPSQSAPVNYGDNYISMFSYCPYHAFDNAQHDTIVTAGMQYVVPVESTMDLTKQCSNYVQSLHTDTLRVGRPHGTTIEPTIPTKNGDSNTIDPNYDFSQNGNGVWVQVEPSTVAGRFTLTTDMYMYNTAYSVLPDVVTYSGEDTVNVVNALNDSRVHYSQKKNNNELIDNWTNFKAIDYLDVDSRCGEITGLKLFRDKLIFLQENGAGILSVNDRTILKDQNSANIIVGNGGVLDRFDYFTTVYGMKRDQHSIDATNNAVYWWDSVRKEILSYVDGYNVTLLQKVRNVQNYVSNGDESTIPSIISDTSKNEVLFNVVNDESLVYNEQTQSFTAVYKFNPIYYCNINEKMFLTDSWDDSPNLYEYHHDVGGVTLFGEVQKPMLRYVVNKDSIYNKVFDIQTFGGRFYEGDVSPLEFTYKTPLKQQSGTTGENVTDREYDFRLAVPRNNNDLYGGRMRGKTMECELTSKSNDQDFSIQYIITKYRMSWT